MLEILQKTLRLQERDQRLQTLLHEINQAPSEKLTLESDLKGAQSDLEKAKTRGKEIEVERARLEVEASSKRAQADKYRTQQTQTRKNEEFTALRHEIERAEKDVVAIEDRELELMQEGEDLRPSIAAADKKFGTEKERVAARIKASGAKVETLQGRVDELRVEREVIAEEIKVSDEDLLDLYDRLFKSKMGRAIVPLEIDHCSGCHMKLTPATLHQAKAGTQIVSCEQCGRIVYFLQE